MYNFVFWVLYKANEKDGRIYGRFNGSLVVAISLIMQLLFIIAAFRKWVLKINTPYGHEWLSKSAKIFIFISLIFAIFFYYNDKRIDKVMNKYRNSGNPTSSINIIKVCLIALLPLILLFIILPKG